MFNSLLSITICYQIIEILSMLLLEHHVSMVLFQFEKSQLRWNLHLFLEEIVEDQEEDS
jgi:hypothetical protein